MKNNHIALLVYACFLVFATIFGGIAGKTATLAFGIWLVHQRKLEYFSLIVLITAFLSTAYILYLQMFIYSLINYKIFNNNGLKMQFNLFILMMVAFVSISIYKFIFMSYNIGLSLTNYSFILVFSSYFYFSILKYFDGQFLNIKRLINILFIIFILNLTAKVFNPDLFTTKLIFFIVPLTFILLFRWVFDMGKSIYRLSMLSFVLMNLDGITFTLIFTAFLTLLLFWFSNNSIRIIYIFIFLSTLVIPFFAINNYQKFEFTTYRDVQTIEIRSVGEFFGRIGMKLFDDRAPIWSSAWDSILKNLNLFPPLESQTFTIESKGNIEQEWEHHAHNVLLESLRSLGLIMGGLVLFLFFQINLKSFRNLVKFRNDHDVYTVLALAVISNFIGSLTGVFPLLLDYAVLGLGIQGIYYLKTDENYSSQ